MTEQQDSVRLQQLKSDLLSELSINAMKTRVLLCSTYFRGYQTVTSDGTKWGYETVQAEASCFFFSHSVDNVIFLTF